MWNPPELDQQNGIIHYYQILLDNAETLTTQKFTTTDIAIVLNDLHPYYTYTCRIAGVTIAPGVETTVTFQMPEDGKKL